MTDAIRICSSPKREDEMRHKRKKEQNACSSILADISLHRTTKLVQNSSQLTTTESHSKNIGLQAIAMYIGADLLEN